MWSLIVAMTNDRRNAARDLLAFYREAGVDSLIDESAIDRFADDDSPQPAQSFISSPTPDPRTSGSEENIGSGPPTRTLVAPAGNSELKGGPGIAAPPSPEVAIMAAREAARSAATLDDLRHLLERFDGCPLKATATQLVFADGNPQARVMLVGEAPGRDEDIEGLPFVGRSGKLLDRMLAAVGLDRTKVYIANIVPWRPPGNRTPTPQESAICLPFIRRQIELANPDVLVCLGGPSAQTLLGIKEGIMKARGRWLAYHTGTREIRALPTFHPAFLLRSPAQKRFAWRDFLAIKKALAE
jgi:DNA polymerase